ncbi:Hypothetical protein NTJ_06354 [Nesidiocoris tenuis]|uniref:Uncharacterized protein n=1 Tax=Nesidiocoris tenuis TaxID=355587 RepID=A0ABN7AMU3_9HEMI|nr:Hypothetical protein NTJ_06354 [Nesidiocoris tenuis]
MIAASERLVTEIQTTFIKLSVTSLPEIDANAAPSRTKDEMRKKPTPTDPDIIFSGLLTPTFDRMSRPLVGK